MHGQPRIALLTTGLALGGAEKQVVLLALALRHRGWRVLMISMLPPEAHTRWLAEGGVELVSLGVRKRVPNITPFFRLALTLWRFRPDVLHCHQVHANLLGRLIRCVCPVPAVISSAHSMREGGLWREWAYRVSDPLCDLTTNVSASATARYRRRRLASARKLLFVPNAINPQPFTGNAQDRNRLRERQGLGAGFAWLAVGNLLEAKDYPNLLAAAAELRQSDPDFRLLIAGAGPLENTLRTIIANRVLEENVSLLGIRTDIPDLMRAADGYVMSSAWEGLANVLLEASCAELPVVATDVGGNREVVRDGTGGILVLPHDPGKLAGAMRQVMHMSPAGRQAMGRAGRAGVVERYSIEKITGRWEEIYAGLLGGIPETAERLRSWT